jgi:hypothetical protein
MGFLQSKSTSTDSTTSTTTPVTLTTANIVPGNKIIGYAFWNAGADDLVQIKDNLGNMNATIVDTVSNGDIQKSFWYDVVVGGAATITLTTTNANGFRGLVCHEVSGLAAGAPEQHQTGNQATPGTGADGITTASVTTVEDGQYVFSAVHVNATVVMTVTQGTGYTDRESIDGTATISPLESEDRIQAAHGSIAGTFTGNSNQPATSAIMTFKQALGGVGVLRFGGSAFHPGASPGLGGISSARFQPSNWWPYSPPTVLTFDPAFMIAMEKHGNDSLVLPPQVVASGMTPPEQMPI